MKIATDLEESKKLSEILPIESADMYYESSYLEKDDYFDPTPIVISEPICFEEHLLTLRPAWSLSALLEIIPSHLGEFKDGIDFGLSKSINGKWYSAHYLKTSEDGDISCVKTVTGDTAIDAVYEMIMWLKENKHI